MQSFSGSVSGRCRLIVDGDNTNAKEVGPGSVTATFKRSVELRDLEAPENRGEGSAQPTGAHDGQAGD